MKFRIPISILVLISISRPCNMKTCKRHSTVRKSAKSVDSTTSLKIYLSYSLIQNTNDSVTKEITNFYHIIPLIYVIIIKDIRFPIDLIPL